MKTGMIFPGQGAQYVGMGKAFYDSRRSVQELFEQATTSLGRNFVRLCFASSDQELTQTSNAQTAIFLTSSAIASILLNECGITPDVIAGHSLGEYSALHAAGGIRFADGLYLLSKRAECMDEATRLHDGTMLAVLGIPASKLQSVCDQYDDPGKMGRVAQIVNYNSRTQLVVSGTRRELKYIKEHMPMFGGKACALKVGGAFHSRLMNSAETNFRRYLTKVDFCDARVPVVSNVDARPVRRADHIRASLARHTSSPVLWWQSMQHFADCDLIIEVGPGTTFGRMLKREWPDKNIVSVNQPSDIEKLMEIYASRKPA